MTLSTMPIRGKVVSWTPQDDITALELAQAMPALLRMDALVRCLIDPTTEVMRLPPQVQRHFTIDQTPRFIDGDGEFDEAPAKAESTR